MYRSMTSPSRRTHRNRTVTVIQIVASVCVFIKSQRQQSCVHGHEHRQPSHGTSSYRDSPRPGIQIGAGALSCSRAACSSTITAVPLRWPPVRGFASWRMEPPTPATVLLSTLAPSPTRIVSPTANPSRQATCRTASPGFAAAASVVDAASSQSA